MLSNGKHQQTNHKSLELNWQANKSLTLGIYPCSVTIVKLDQRSFPKPGFFSVLLSFVPSFLRSFGLFNAVVCREELAGTEISCDVGRAVLNRVMWAGQC